MDTSRAAASPPETMRAAGPTFHQVQQVLQIGPVTFAAVNFFNGQLAISEGPFMVRVKSSKVLSFTGLLDSSN